jgi:serine/threonine protein kinase/WD40 repeat protein
MDETSEPEPTDARPADEVSAPSDEDLSDEPTEDTPIDEFDIEEALVGLDVGEVKPILDLIENVWPVAKSKAEKAFSRFPMKFARFRVERELGRGGFGVVFEAYDPLLGRNVALKLPRSEVILTPGMADRFYAEARASAGLSHPNVVQVLEAGEYGPTCYIVSELCDGPNLRDWLATQTEPVQPRDAATFVLALADAVAYAQRMGILHRDIKPSNILMARPPREREFARESVGSVLGVIPKLSDFGLAKMLEEESTHTPAGTVVGTPEYMAPEQAEGRVEEINESTDVYGLGTVLYEVLVGRPAIEGKTTVDKLRRVLVQDPTDPRRRRHDIPRDLEAIVIRCLRKDSRDRYANAQELADDLRRFLSGKATQARPLPWVQKVWKWMARHPAESSLISVVSLFVGVAAVLGWLHQEQVDQAEEKVEQAQQAVEDQQRDAQIEHSKLLDMKYAADLREAKGSIDAGNVEQAIAILNRHLPGTVSQDRRCFAWRMLWRQCHQEQDLFDIHTDNVYSVSFSPDGRFLASGGVNGVTMVTDLETNESRSLDLPHAGELNNVQYSDDGRWLVSSGDDGSIQVRDSDGTLLRTIVAALDTPRVYCMSLHPTRPQVAVGTDPKRLSLWNLETGELVREWSLEGRTLEAISFTRDGLGIVVGDSDGGIWLIEDMETSSPRLMARVSSTILAMAVVPSPEGSHGSDPLLVSGRNRQIALVDLKLGRVTRQWPAHHDWVQAIGVSADGQKCVSVGRDRMVKVWDIPTGRLLGRIVGHRERIWNVAMHPDGEHFATCSSDRSIRLWSLQRAGEVQTIARWPEAPVDVVAGPKGKQVVSALPSGEVSVWSVSSMLRLDSTHVTGGIVSFDVSARGPMAVATADGKVHFFNFDEEMRFRSLGSIDVEQPLDVAISSDGRAVAVSSISGAITLISIHPDKPMEPFPPTHRVPDHPEGNQWNWVKFSPDGKTMVAGAYDGAIQFWEASSMNWLRSHYRQYDLSDVCFDPTSTKLASVSIEPAAVIESVPYGARLANLWTGDSGGGKSVVYSRDGRNLLIGLADGILSVWDATLGQELFREATTLQEVSHLEMTLNGEYLLISGRDKFTGEGVLQVRSGRVRKVPSDD